MTLEDEIARVPMFRRLAAEDRARLAGLARLETFARGQVLFREGDPSLVLYLVVTGRIKVVKSTPSGRDLILDLFGPGDPVGAVAVFEARPFPAAAIALVDATCIGFERDAFLAALDAHPSLVRGLLSGFSLRLVELTARLSDLTGLRVEARIARSILGLAETESERRADGLFVPVRLSRQELADLCGTTIETAIRVMSRWGKDGIVRTEPEGFLLLDRDALSDIAQG